MERYRILEELGDGSCGSVYRAIKIDTFEIVAVKKMKRKFYCWQECLNLREVKSLRQLKHPNIIKLLEIVQENNELFFIFEYMEHNLYQIMKDRNTPCSEGEIRSLMFQVLEGLSYVHKHGYFHRDLKPENLLVTNNTIKIADFGLARELSSVPPFTDYVSTRWYRAPEVLVQSATYSPAIDMWAVGAILAELFTSCPIFPGESEIDQLYKICCVLGAPGWNAFPEATNICGLVGITHTYPEIMSADLSDLIPNTSLEAIDLIKQLLSWDPSKRPNADQCLQHPFFHVATFIPRPLRDEPNLELNLWNVSTKADDHFLGLTLALPSPSLGMVHRNKETQDNVLVSGFHDHPQESVFWPYFPTDQNMFAARVESSLSLSFSSIPCQSIGVTQSAGFSMAPSFQPNILDSSLLTKPSIQLTL